MDLPSINRMLIFDAATASEKAPQQQHKKPSRGCDMGTRYGCGDKNVHHIKAVGLPKKIADVLLFLLHCRPNGDSALTPSRCEFS
jgi:hypothetical protein